MTSSWNYSEVAEYYLINMAIAHLDHLTAEFEARFSELSVKASKLLGLIPSIVCSQQEDMGISPAVKMYVIRSGTEALEN